MSHRHGSSSGWQKLSVTDKQRAAVHRRMVIWLTFWIVAGLCGLPMLDKTTVFGVSLMTAIAISKGA